MKLHQLKYFLAVAQTRNFTRAAEQCHVAQPSLSRAIQELEVELGGPLFKRQRGPNDLTPLGRFVHQHIRQVDDQLRQIRVAAQCWRSLEAPLNIGVQSSIGAGVLTDFIAEFGRAHPRLDIEIRDGDAAALEQGIDGGLLDLAFAVANALPHQRLTWHALFREPMMIAFAGGHRFADRKVVRLHELDGEIYVDHLACDRRQEFGRELARRGIEVKAAYRSNRADWVMNAVAAGLGVAIAPRSAIILPAVQSRRLVDPAVEREIGLLVPAREELSPAATAFVQAAKQRAWPSVRH
jgi:LysR family transcriptional regulator, hydrogen peroxide-inducible genes activator